MTTDRILPKGYTFIYDEESGESYVWSIKTNKALAVRTKINKKDGRKMLDTAIGYNENGKWKTLHYFIHRLVALHYIPNPDNLPLVDHIDGNPLNNRKENLRWVDNSKNGHNQVKAKGYTWDKARNKWKAHISVNKKQINLGRFDTKEEARKCYLEASEKYYPGIKQVTNIDE